MSKIVKKLNFNIPVTEPDGEVVMWKKTDKNGRVALLNKEPVMEESSLRRAIYNALKLPHYDDGRKTAFFKEEENLDASALISTLTRRAKLGKKVLNASTVKYDQEEIDMIVSRVAQAHDILVLRNVIEVIEADDEVKAEDSAETVNAPVAANDSTSEAA